MTDTDQPIVAAPIQVLQPLLAGVTKGLIDLARRFACGLADIGLPASFALQGDWAKLTVLTEQGAIAFALMEPEISGLSREGLPIRVGVSLSFGVPDGNDLTDKPETFFYLPASFTVDQLLALGRGQFSPKQFTELLNMSVRHAMSAPRDNFPRSILLMIGERTSLRDSGVMRFELWTQSRGIVDIQNLSPTNNPHIAAAEARSLGFQPTIYRCQSGKFIGFMTTDGGVFL
ncbi:hypothetical protein PVE_R2G0279 [Pseudomonas veronii 1YdBTEX2]|uniref:Uncharacterized protein n=1 Tax=Pseudomonas veronii 1YdBTEX2 TaxID=1295141 RepID=A0A1D3K7J5_PSEVE|nr:hypothetical protein PVE_R2G0279 [Pseudomonas veronii 1YdBTEX2]